MDWDKLRIFQAVADAGSFTQAGSTLGLSQSAVSRQISSLEYTLEVPLFHRHARGLLLTEQGEVLLQTVKEVMLKLDTVRMRLVDSREKPHGDLRITTTICLGTEWLAPKLSNFLDLYPKMRLQIILTDEDLDLSMREADIAIWTRPPIQPDLIQRRLFTIHFHPYAAPSYLERWGEPKTLEELDQHRILDYNIGWSYFLNECNSLKTVGRESKNPRTPILTMNNLSALHGAVRSGIGISLLPDYLVHNDPLLRRLLLPIEQLSFDCYLVYPEELKSVARVRVLRDFLVEQAQKWSF